MDTRASVAAIALWVGFATAAPATPSTSAAALRSEHAALREALDRSAFGRPLIVRSSEMSDRIEGDVYAVVAQPFSTVAQLLSDKAHWCEVMVLHQNVKRCRTAGTAPQESLTMVVGPKAQSTVQQGHEMVFAFGVPARGPDFVRVRMTAAEGPLGTRDHRAVMQAAPLDARRTFIHLSYSHALGGVARMATQAYLATAGRDKVGFTVTGRDDGGQPRYIRGERGMAERNAMRYFLAIEAYFSALSVPPAQQQDKRLRTWFSLTEQHPAQLRELSRDDYLAIKQRELGLQ